MSYSITSPEIWFFNTVDERNSAGVYRLRLLPGQFAPDDKGAFVPVDVNLNVQGINQPRQENMVGSIFASRTLTTEKTANGTKFYSAGKELIAIARGTSADISNAYNEYRRQTGGAPAAAPAAGPASTANPKPRTLIEKLLDSFPCPTIAKDNFYVNPEIWKSLLFNIHQGYNTMLMGESGTGKTELAQKLAEVLKREIKIFDMGAKQDPIASLIGVHRFDGGKSVFDRADFTYCIEKEGIVVLDELPRAPMNTNNILFPILDSRRELTMDIASSELRSIKVNPNCRFIATANEGFRYTGNNILDQALKERFQPIIIDFMPNPMEIELLMKRTGVGKTQAEVIVKAAHQIRTLAAKDELNMGVSVRHSLYAADLTAGGFTVVSAMELAFLPMYTVEEERKKVKDLLSAR